MISKIMIQLSCGLTIVIAEIQPKMWPIVIFGVSIISVVRMPRITNPGSGGRELNQALRPKTTDQK